MSTQTKLSKERQHLVNLTNDIAYKGNLWIPYGRYCSQGRKNGDPRLKFVDQITEELFCSHVKNMSGANIGMIISSIEIGEVMANKQELLSPLTFAGDCEETMKWFAARCLAFVIWERFEKAKGYSSTTLPGFEFSPKQTRPSSFLNLETRSFELRVPGRTI